MEYKAKVSENTFYPINELKLCKQVPKAFLCNLLSHYLTMIAIVDDGGSLSHWSRAILGWREYSSALGCIETRQDSCQPSPAQLSSLPPSWLEEAQNNRDCFNQYSTRERWERGREVSTGQGHITPLLAGFTMNGPRRTACFAKRMHSYTLFTLK